MEIQQLLGGQKREAETKQNGTKYKRCAESEEETEHEITDKKRKAAIFVLKLCDKYLRYMYRGCCFVYNGVIKSKYNIMILIYFKNVRLIDFDGKKTTK